MLREHVSSFSLHSVCGYVARQRLRSNDGFRVGPFIEKPPMATAGDAGSVFDTDQLPEMFGMRWRRPL